MLHQNIKEGIKEALREKNTIRLEVLRSIGAMCQNEIIATGTTAEFLPDEKVLSLVRRSAKQHKDSIEQFEKGGRKDLVEKEQAELVILNSFLPQMMGRPEIKIIASQRIEALKSAGNFDPKAAGKLTGLIMKELAGKADGADVKAVVEELVG